MERAISIINQFDLTQEQIDAFVEQVKTDIDSRKSLQLLARLTAMEKIVKSVKDAIKDQMIDEAQLEGQKTFMQNNIRYELRGKSTYDYKDCPAWVQAKGRLTTIENVMKTIKAPIADVETGEIIEPAKVNYTEYLAVTLPKK